MCVTGFESERVRGVVLRERARAGGERQRARERETHTHTICSGLGNPRHDSNPQASDRWQRVRERERKKTASERESERECSGLAPAPLTTLVHMQRIRQTADTAHAIVPSNK